MQHNKPVDPRSITIPLFEVASSNIKAIGYDKNLKRLRIQFKSSPTLYDYLDVPIEIYVEMSKSDSIGRFFFTKIKSQFKMEKIEK